MHGAGQVVCPDELADPRGVDRGHTPEIKFDAPLTATEKSADVVSQLFVERQAKWALHLKDGWARSRHGPNRMPDRAGRIDRFLTTPHT
jgi:hypothetical protein